MRDRDRYAEDTGRISDSTYRCGRGSFISLRVKRVAIDRRLLRPLRLYVSIVKMFYTIQLSISAHNKCNIIKCTNHRDHSILYLILIFN